MRFRLNKYIAECGYSSRRKADELIENGFVSVNGKIVTENPFFIESDSDIVEVEGKSINLPEEFVYYMVNKPEGYVSTVSDPHATMTVCDLVPSEPRVFPVGRLDVDSCGLILLTNDGEFANILTHPSFDHEKEYEVFASWNIKFPGKKKAKKLLSKMANGILIDGKMTREAVVESRRIDETGILFRIILKEGRKRQIRKMCSTLGLEVKNLKRIRIGKFILEDLIPGDYVKVNKSDIL